MGYGTPTPSEGYDPYENEKNLSKAEKRENLKRRQPKYEGYNPKESRRQKAGRVITGLKQIGRGTLREASGFAKEVRTEGIRSGYKTNRTLQRTGRQLRQPRSRMVRQPRTRMVQYRPVFPPSAGLGERTVIEASSNYTPHLDRSYFNEGLEQRDLIGQGTRDMSSLVETPDNIIKKKNQQYY